MLLYVYICTQRPNCLGYVIRNGKLSDHTARPSFHHVALLFPEYKEHQYCQHSRVEDEPVARPAELVQSLDMCSNGSQTYNVYMMNKVESMSKELSMLFRE